MPKYLIRLDSAVDAAASSGGSIGIATATSISNALLLTGSEIVIPAAAWILIVLLGKTHIIMLKLTDKYAENIP